MLVLSRKKGQQILVGDQIGVTVLSIDKSRVRLGITAPGHLAILRTELVGVADVSGEKPVRNKESAS